MSKGTPLCTSWEDNAWGIKMFCELPRGHWSDQHLYSLNSDEWTERSMEILLGQTSFGPGQGRRVR